MTTECVGTTESAKAIVQKKLQTSAKIQVTRFKIQSKKMTFLAQC